MKKIALIDVDGHKFPNLPLMKLSAHHKAQGDEVVVGGTGYNLKSKLPDEIEHTCPGLGSEPHLV